MKKRTLLIIGLFIFVILGAAGGYYWAKTHGKLTASADSILTGPTQAFCTAHGEGWVHLLGGMSYCDSLSSPTTSSSTSVITTQPTTTSSSSTTNSSSSIGSSSSSSSNNWGTSVTLPNSAAPLVSISFDTSAKNVSAGGSATLTWAASGTSILTKCVGSGSDSFSNAVTGLGGTILVSNIQQSLALTITCTVNGTASKTVNITVSNPSTCQTNILSNQTCQQATFAAGAASAATPITSPTTASTSNPSAATATTTSSTPTATLTANGSSSDISIDNKTKVTITWSSANSTWCNSSGVWASTSSVGTSGSTTIGPLSSSNYVGISCGGSSGQFASHTINITVSTSAVAPVSVTTYKTTGTYISSTLSPETGMQFNGSLSAVNQKVPANTSIEYQIGQADSSGTVASWTSLGKVSGGQTTTLFTLSAVSNIYSLEAGPIRVKMILYSTDGKGTPSVDGFQLMMKKSTIVSAVPTTVTTDSEITSNNPTTTSSTDTSITPSLSVPATNSASSGSVSTQSATTGTPVTTNTTSTTPTNSSSTTSSSPATTVTSSTPSTSLPSTVMSSPTASTSTTTSTTTPTTTSAGTSATTTTTAPATTSTSPTITTVSGLTPSTTTVTKPMTTKPWWQATPQWLIDLLKKFSLFQ